MLWFSSLLQKEENVSVFPSPLRFKNQAIILDVPVVTIGLNFNVVFAVANAHVCVLCGFYVPKLPYRIGIMW